MIGRAAYQNPYMLAELDQRLHGRTEPVPGQDDIVERLLDYIEAELADGTRLNSITRHILGLYHDVPGAKYWRRYLSQNACKPGAGAEVVREALQQVRQQRERLREHEQSRRDFAAVSH
jgi:tRNA-dihydrouridine synthase A